MGALHAQYWLCSVCDQLCLPAFGWSTAGLHCFLELLPILRVGCSQKTLSTAGGAVIQLFAWVWENWTHGPAKFFLWGSESGRSASCHILWSKYILTWFCNWAKPLIGITPWALQVWTWSADICGLVVARPSLLLCHTQIPNGLALPIPLQSPWCKAKQGLPQGDLSAGEGWVYPLGSPFTLEDRGA